MLDPVELADSETAETGFPPVQFKNLIVVEHRGRVAWAATACPTEYYDLPHICCPLLGGEFDDERQRWIPQGESRVRLDVETGICVFLAQIGTDQEWIELDVQIAEVNQGTDGYFFLH